jgi:hypothetical protein
MSRRKLIIIAIVTAVVLAIAGGTAYAWWTASDATGTNTLTTGNEGLTISSSGSALVTASNLLPQTLPDLGADDAAYAAVSYLWVHNSGSTPLMFYGYLWNGSGDTVINSAVHVRVWLLASAIHPPNWTGLPTGWNNTFSSGGPYLSFDGTLASLWNDAENAGINYLSSRYWAGAWHHTPMGAGEWGVYRVAVWLDGPSATNAMQNKSVSFTLNFKGMLESEWVALGLDASPYNPTL